MSNTTPTPTPALTPTKKKSTTNSPTYNTWHLGPYKTGDGDFVQVRRPGSDLSRYKSKGFRC